MTTYSLSHFTDNHTCSSSLPNFKDRYIAKLHDLEGARGIFASGYGPNTLHDGRCPLSYKEKNIFDGSIVKVHKKSVTFPSKLLWVIYTNEDGDSFLYKPQDLGNHEFSMGNRAYNVTNWDDMLILTELFSSDGCLDGYSYKNNRRTFYEPKEICRTLWSVEFDGKNILAILFAKPKMSYNDVKLIITNEGGSVDSNGIIHKPIK